MGDSISEGTVISWMKNPGDPVEEDEVVVVLETDKVSRGAHPFAHEMVFTFPRIAAGCVLVWTGVSIEICRRPFVHEMMSICPPIAAVCMDGFSREIAGVFVYRG